LSSNITLVMILIQLLIILKILNRQVLKELLNYKKFRIFCKIYNKLKGKMQ